jgi:protein arginine kinase activator
MQCQKCGENKATVHWVKEVNGKQSEAFLCHFCAGGMGNIGFGFSQELIQGLDMAFHNFLPGFIGHSKNLTHSLPQNPICEQCGLSFDAFEKIGRMGCGNCYQTFFNQLAPILSRIHGNVEYKGKIPLRGEKDESMKGPPWRI